VSECFVLWLGEASRIACIICPIFHLQKFYNRDQVVCGGGMSPGNLGHFVS
jgi:hypothetical protein